jgi:AMMECR1 domain-containing protein
MVDPRLPPVTIEEWSDLDISVSVLTPLHPIRATDLTELARVLRPGRDGLVLTDGNRRATFLPSVWEKISSPERFVSALLAKGGWSSAAGQSLEFLGYETVEFHDPAPRAPLAGAW